MNRWPAFLVLAVFAFPACGGGGASSLFHNATNGGSGSTPASGKRTIGVTLTIPAPSASSSSIVRRPKTVSSSTESVTISVNGATPQVFNISSGNGCTTSNSATTCTFTVGASYGLDTFLILTYGAANAGGTVLNAAAETLNVTSSSPNSFTATAGNAVYVTTNADSGSGSLRAAVASAAPGVTTAILFQGLTGTIVLASPITIAQSVAIIGPGASILSISGGNATSLFTVNSATSAVFFGLTLTQGNAATEGGAIFSDGNLAIFSSTLSTNTASTAGGAIEVDDGTLVATGAIFTGNSVASTLSASGGAIDAYGDMTIDSSTFQNNSVTVSGSNVSAAGGAISINDYETQGLALTNTQFYGNSATSPNGYSYGGAIEEDSGAPALLIEGDTFGKTGAGNTASAKFVAEGGAFEYYSSGAVTDAGVGGNSFVDNSATAASGGYGDGGAIVFDLADSGASLSFTGNNNTFTGNSAIGGFNGSAGAIDVDGTGGTLTISSSTTFTSNTAKSTDASDGGAFGGAISYFYFPCISESKSLARRPGTSVAKAGGRAPMLARRAVAATWRRNPLHHAASKRRAMGLATNSAIGGTFTSNTAGPSTSYGAGGGAIDLEMQTDSSPTFTIANATITSNSVTGTGFYGDGGGIDIFSGVVSITNSTIGSQGAGNSAITRGGGVVVGFSGAAYSICGTLYAGNLTITNSTVASNSLSGASNVAFGGGGLANGSSVLSINGSTIAFNSISNTTTGGGGIFAVGGGGTATTTILNSTLFANTSSNFGGGIMNNYSGSGSTISITNGTAYQNTATSAGGNIYNADGVGGNVISAQNSIAAGGAAASGSDIWNLDTFVSLGYNLVQQSSHYGSGTSNAPQTGDLVGQSPGLAPSLADNGGPTLTLADTSSSPGKGHVPFASGLCNGATGTSVDQRGFSRGAGGVCDIGAYEFSGASP